MKLFDEINNYLSYAKQEVMYFTFLSYYDPNEDNKECLRLINQLTKKIINSMEQYKLVNSDELYNTIDNDFITLKALYAEYRDYGYNFFSFKALALIKNLKKEELRCLIHLQQEFKFTNEYLTLVIEQINYVMKLINNKKYTFEVSQYLQSRKLNSESLEPLIMNLKQYQKNNEIEGIREAYLKLIFLYFNYLLFN